MIAEYPYGQFPTKFTKNGQKKYFEEIKEEQKIQTMSTETPQQTPPQNQFDFGKLLPLLKLMGDKKSISNTDMLKMFIPMLGGDSNMSELLSLMSPTKQDEQVEDLTLSDTISTDGYTRVE